MYQCQASIGGTEPGPPCLHTIHSPWTWRSQEEIRRDYKTISRSSDFVHLLETTQVRIENLKSWILIWFFGKCKTFYISFLVIKTIPDSYFSFLFFLRTYLTRKSPEMKHCLTFPPPFPTQYNSTLFYYSQKRYISPFKLIPNISYIICLWSIHIFFITFKGVEPKIEPFNP